MATVAHKPARFVLPQRVRSGQESTIEGVTKTHLIDRIADLPGIEAVRHRDDVIPSSVDLYLKNDNLQNPDQNPESTLFCSLSNDGIEIFRLDRWTKHQVISRGWGKLTARDVLVFLPRTNRELETVWKIIQRAYDNFLGTSASAIGTQMVSTWDLPKFSRTTLH